MKVRVGVSNRHVHLCQRDANILFGENYQFEKRNDLSQTGEYACMETVIVKTDNYEFPHVRVMGPLRPYTQVEVSSDDANLLGVNPPMRDSGDLENSEAVWIEGPVGTIYKENCCILANRHIHCSKKDNIGYENGDVVKVKVGDKVIDQVHIKMKDSFTLEMHIDKTDALKYELNNGDFVELD